MFWRNCFDSAVWVYYLLLPFVDLVTSYFLPVGVGTLSGLICRATANRNKITLTNCMVLICIFFVCRMWVNPANYHMYSDKYTNWTGCFLTSWLLSSVCEFPALLELVLMSFWTYQFELSWMFLLEQQARKRGWPHYNTDACAQCRARADPQQVAASTMFMYLYLYLGFSVTQCIMHSDLPMFVLLQAAKQKQQEEEAARKKKAEEEAARTRKQQQEEATKV